MWGRIAHTGPLWSRREGETMRTIFDDITAQSNREEESKGGSKAVPLVLWLVALAFMVGTWSVYRWVLTQPAPEPPPPPVSLEDLRQTSEAFSTFNRYVREGNWEGAEKMLSRAALDRLTKESKSLQESLLAERKADRVVEAASTPSGERLPELVRQDCVYKFADGKFKIVPLFLIMEEGRLVIDRWAYDEPEEKTKRG
jgi:hypothetical protein